MKKQIAIVDYGLGNILSAQQSFLRVASEKKLDAEIIITNNPSQIKKSSHVVLPGQGAFKTCMAGLSNIPGMVEELSDFALNYKKPFLGICVGMQLLASKSEENGVHEGLDWIKGCIKKIPSNKLKLPHMGWNSIKLKKEEKQTFFFLENDYYFVHSYYFDTQSEKNILAETHYGIDFPSIVNQENIYGVQFHPEKSSNQGLKLIEGFMRL